MSASIRTTLKARVIGEQLTKVRECELSKGLKVKTHKFRLTPQPKKLEDMKEKLENELQQQYAAELPVPDAKYRNNRRAHFRERDAYVNIELLDVLISENVPHAFSYFCINT